MPASTCKTLGEIVESRYRRLLAAVRHHVTAATDVVVLYHDFGVTDIDPCASQAVNLAGGPLAVIQRAFAERHRLSRR